MKKQDSSEIRQVGLGGDVVAQGNPVSDAAGAQAAEVTENKTTVQNDEGKENKVVDGNASDVPVETVATGPEPVADDLNMLCGDFADAPANQTGDHVVESVSEQVAAMEEVPVDNSTPEPERPITGEEIQAARDASEEDAWDDKTRGVMENTTLRYLTPYIKGELTKGNESEIKVGIWLQQGHNAVNDDSFRVWVTKVLGMEPKRAYELRAIGRVFGPLLQKHIVTLPYLCSLGTSRLTTITRLPETYWRVNETGHIVVSDGNTETTAENISNDELRKILQTVKTAVDSKHGGLILFLDDLDRRCPWRDDYKAAVEPVKAKLLTQLMAWDGDLATAVKGKDDRIKNLQKSIEETKTERAAVVATRGRAKWWFDLLNGNDGEMPEWEENTAKLREQEATRERALNAQARVEKTRNRR